VHNTLDQLCVHDTPDHWCMWNICASSMSNTLAAVAPSQLYNYGMPLCAELAQSGALEKDKISQTVHRIPRRRKSSIKQIARQIDIYYLGKIHSVSRSKIRH